MSIKSQHDHWLKCMSFCLLFASTFKTECEPEDILSWLCNVSYCTSSLFGVLKLMWKILETCSIRLDVDKGTTVVGEQYAKVVKSISYKLKLADLHDLSVINKDLLQTLSSVTDAENVSNCTVL